MIQLELDILHPNRVKYLRMKKGTTVTQLATIAKVSRMVVYKLESEPPQPTRPEIKVRIANALGEKPLIVFPRDPQLVKVFGDDYEPTRTRMPGVGCIRF